MRPNFATKLHFSAFSFPKDACSVSIICQSVRQRECTLQFAKALIAPGGNFAASLYFARWRGWMTPKSASASIRPFIHYALGASTTAAAAITFTARFASQAPLAQR
jgi:hypothetical protein